METIAGMSPELALFFEEHVESVLRLFLAAAFGGVIGLEREASGKPAGFRTNLLICLGAALITQLSLQVAYDGTLPGGLRSDPGRIAAQIVSGIGFLGAGTILHSRGSVTGLTTAATLWVVAAIGMATGTGAYVLAVTGTLLVMLALMLLGRFETSLLTSRSVDRTIRVVTEPRAEVVTAIEHVLMDTGFQLGALDVEKSEDSFLVSFTTRGEGGDIDAAVTRMLRRDGIRQVTMS